jgi:hypothetical protein
VVPKYARNPRSIWPIREVLGGLASRLVHRHGAGDLGALVAAPVWWDRTIGALLSIPSAVLAAVCLLLLISPAIAIAAVLTPRVGAVICFARACCATVASDYGGRFRQHFAKAQHSEAFCSRQCR